MVTIPLYIQLGGWEGDLMKNWTLLDICVWKGHNNLRNCAVWRLYFCLMEDQEIMT